MSRCINCGTEHKELRNGSKCEQCIHLESMEKNDPDNWRTRGMQAQLDARRKKSGAVWDAQKYIEEDRLELVNSLRAHKRKMEEII